MGELLAVGFGNCDGSQAGELGDKGRRGGRRLGAGNRDVRAHGSGHASDVDDVFYREREPGQWARLCLLGAGVRAGLWAALLVCGRVQERGDRVELGCAGAAVCVHV